MYVEWVLCEYHGNMIVSFKDIKKHGLCKHSMQMSLRLKSRLAITEILYFSEINLNIVMVILDLICRYSHLHKYLHKRIQWSPLNRITDKGMFWLMECNLQVQNHLLLSFYHFVFAF